MYTHAERSCHLLFYSWLKIFLGKEFSQFTWKKTKDTLFFMIALQTVGKLKVNQW